jgi:agmatine/peptidylarginine deiminase
MELVNLPQSFTLRNSGDNMTRFCLIAALTTVLISCQQLPVDLTPVAGIALEAADPATNAEVPALLPAYQLEWEKRIPGKADELDDWRMDYPQWYAITEPPVKDNFRPMREWEPMQAMLITFSAGLTFDTAVSATLIDSVVAATEAGEVWVVADGEGPVTTVKIKLKMAGLDDATIDEKIKFFDIPNNAFWFIDYGPFPIIDEDTQSYAFADFLYYHYRHLDDAIPTRLGNQLGINTYRSPFPFEGGNFQADGDEYCYYGERTYALTGLSAAQIEKIAADYYGCKKSVVLKDITNDGTGHIDMFFKLGSKQVAFIGDYTVVEDATNKKRMDDNTALLEAIEYSDGSDGITVYRIPMPNPYQGVPRTFINSTLYVSADSETKLNLWPMYTVDKDLEAEALAVWEEGLPDWQHIGIISDQISLLSGAVHCVTRTIPALAEKKWVEDSECVDGACDGGENGYDGGCLPPSADAPGCWGPAWECQCNNCNKAGCELPADCGDGECGAGEDCFTCPADCGCGGGEICNMVAGECDTCGDGECSEGENCLSCPFDCGCDQYQACVFGICTKTPCGGVPYQGCCDGSTVVYCSGGQLQSENCGGEGCGWGDSAYECGGSHSDPDGMAQDCHDYDYPTGCGNRECGHNGAGFSCGECGDGENCVDGFCESGCTPDCDGKVCGDDGCGGSCGECEAGFTCEPDGTCFEAPSMEDVVSQPDVAGEDEVASQEDLPSLEETAGEVDVVTEEPKKNDSGGCSATGQGTIPTPLFLLFAGMLLVVGAMRLRRSAQ